MDIVWLGHSSFKISFSSAKAITDPFNKTSVGINFSKEEADIVTVSHDHDDHNSVDSVGSVKRVINGPGEYEIEGVSVIGIASFHDDNKGADRGKNTMYVFEADGLRLAHLGDLGHKLSEKQIDNLGDIDILMLPVGGVYTIDSKTAADVARSIEANIIVPMYYKVPGLNEKVFGSLESVEPFITALGSKRVDAPKLSVKRNEELTEEQVVYVLEKK